MNALASRTRWIQIALAACASFAAGCQDVAGGQATSGSDSGDKSQEGAEDDEQIDVVEAIPISLLDMEYLVVAETQLPSSGEPTGSSEQVRDETLDVLAENVDLTKSLVTMPVRAAGELARVLKYLTRTGADLEALVKNDNGPLKVPLASGRGIQRFKLANQTTPGSAIPAFLEVSVDKTLPVGLVTIDTYSRAGDKRLERRTRYEFEASGSPLATSSVRVLHIQDLQVGREFVDARYSRIAGTVSVDFGDEAPATHKPRRTRLALTLPAPEKAQLGSVVGAQIWGDRPKSPGAAPRYYSPVANDVEVFTKVFDSLKIGRSSNHLAFVPNEQIANWASHDHRVFFSEASYTRHMRDFLVTVIRDAAINPKCAAAGEVFRAAFQGHNPPDIITTLAADLCATNVATNDEAVAQALSVTCDAEIYVAIEARVSSGEARILNLCEKLAEANPLQNPNFFSFSGGTSTYVPVSAAEPEHAALAKAAEALSLPDIGSFVNAQFFAVETRDEEDFHDARLLP